MSVYILQWMIHIQNGNAECIWLLFTCRLHQNLYQHNHTLQTGMAL